ncbi:MAG TPA: BlaI/MecI/CopY family transcriptional regulator [Longimicrobiaceae bacterium]|nr:BlaI/MecI/CopY family transcriptional regulator [Longimicrobiaceae bacterium]
MRPRSPEWPPAHQTLLAYRLLSIYNQRMNAADDPRGRPTDRVPDAELEILAFIQHRGKATAREVREGIAAFRPLAHSSVVTLLNRLEARGLVTRRKAGQGKAFLYAPTHGRSATVRPLLRRLLNRVYGGDSVALVASLFETKPPSERELEELERMVDDLRRRRETE